MLLRGGGGVPHSEFVRKTVFLVRWIASALLVGVFVSACSDGSDRRPGAGDNYLPIDQPLIEQPPDVGEPFLQLASYDLAEIGYQKREYFFSGVASAFRNVNELGSDGLWQIDPGETAEYKTRLVVLRPADSNQFSGTVYIEWLNVTGGFDRPPVWISGHTGIVRDGHAWVGVSAE